MSNELQQPPYAYAVETISGLTKFFLEEELEQAEECYGKIGVSIAALYMRQAPLSEAEIYNIWERTEKNDMAITRAIEKAHHIQ